MSLLIRKTKKCCAKLLRKIQQSTMTGHTEHEMEHRHARDSSNKKCNYNNSNNHVSQSNNNNNNNNRSSKNEKLSKNNNGNVKRTNILGRTPSTNASNSHHHRRSHFNPASDSFIYERCTDTHSTSTVDEDSANGHSSSSGSSDADDEDDITKVVYPSTRHNIKKRLQSVQQAANLNNNYTELRSSRQHQQQLHNNSTMSSTASTFAPRTRISKRLHAMASTRYAQEDIVFTENQIYIGLKEIMNAQNSTATNLGQKLMDKRPFNVVSNMDNQNEQTPKNYAKNFHDGGFCEQIIFEKVKYDKNKRYLQTSPVSTGSTTSRTRVAPESADILNYHAFLNDHTSQTRTSSMYIEDQHNTTFTQQWPMSRQSSRRLQNEVLQHNDSLNSNNNMDAWQSMYDNDAGYVEQNSILDNHRNRIRSTTPSPPDSLIESRTGNNNQNNNSYYYERASASFSRRSSISTTETWVDDESFDNSFNEELEKRCEVFCR